MGLWLQCEKEAAHPSFLFLLLPRSPHPPLLRRHNVLPSPHTPNLTLLLGGSMFGARIPARACPSQAGGVPVQGTSSVALNPT